MTDYIVVLVTAKDNEEARNIANALVEDELAACVNIVDEVSSIFRWEENVEDAKEALLIVKSHQDKFDKLKEKVKSVHSYDVPEIIALPIVAGDKDYLDWVNDSVN